MGHVLLMLRIAARLLCAHQFPSQHLYILYVYIYKIPRLHCTAVTCLPITSSENLICVAHGSHGRLRVCTVRVHSVFLWWPLMWFVYLLLSTRNAWQWAKWLGADDRHNWAHTASTWTGWEKEREIEITFLFSDPKLIWIQWIRSSGWRTAQGATSTPTSAID